MRRTGLILSALITCSALLATACLSTSVISEGSLDPDDAPTESQPAADTDGTATDTSAAGEAGADDRNADDGNESADESSGDDATSDDDPADASGDESAPQGQAERDAAALFGIGSDEQIAGLANDCEGGSDLACDILFQASTRGSGEEALALSCAGRGSGGPDFCTDGIDADGTNIWFSDGSPGLDDVVEQCRDGNMTACDFLYYRSAVDSLYEELGNTCAGRIDVALPDCRTAFPDG